MFVVEDRHGTLGAFEDLANLREEAPPRVEDLAALVGRVLAVLADTEHALDREFLAAAADRPIDSVVDREAVLLRQVAAHVAGGELVAIECDELQVRELLAVEVVTFEDLGEDDVGVRPLAILGDDGGDLLFHARTPACGLAPLENR